ncbi:MAG: hypothetical protein ACREHG_00305 [Candidatus Saccharimonadales bacterium]
MSKLEQSGDKVLKFKCTESLFRKIHTAAKKAKAESTSAWIRAALVAATK